MTDAEISAAATHYGFDPYTYRAPARIACVTTRYGAVIVLSIDAAGEAEATTTYCRGSAGQHVRFYVDGGRAEQAFASGGRARTWQSLDPAAQARQVACFSRIPFVAEADVGAWVAANAEAGRAVHAERAAHHEWSRTQPPIGCDFVSV